MAIHADAPNHLLIGSQVVVLIVLDNDLFNIVLLVDLTCEVAGSTRHTATDCSVTVCFCFP